MGHPLAEARESHGATILLRAARQASASGASQRGSPVSPEASGINWAATPTPPESLLGRMTTHGKPGPLTYAQAASPLFQPHPLIHVEQAPPSCLEDYEALHIPPQVSPSPSSPPVRSFNNDIHSLMGTPPAFQNCGLSPITWVTLEPFATPTPASVPSSPKPQIEHRSRHPTSLYRCSRGLPSACFGHQDLSIMAHNLSTNR